MMKYKELEKMDDWEITYNYLIFYLKHFSQKIEHITLSRSRTEKGRPAAEVTVYLKGFNGTESNLTLWLFDDSFVWFLNSISADFPDVNIVDMTPRYYQQKK